MLYGMSGRGTGRVSFDPEAAARVRQLLAGRDDVVERTMVDGLSFLVNGNMCCGVTGTAAGSDGGSTLPPASRPSLSARAADRPVIETRFQGQASSQAWMR
jgi:hypothetical protein